MAHVSQSLFSPYCIKQRVHLEYAIIASASLCEHSDLITRYSVASSDKNSNHFTQLWQKQATRVKYNSENEWHAVTH